jgi:hypothetical protein
MANAGTDPDHPWTTLQDVLSVQPPLEFVSGSVLWAGPGWHGVVHILPQHHRQVMTLGDTEREVRVSIVALQDEDRPRVGSVYVAPYSTCWLLQGLVVEPPTTPDTALSSPPPLGIHVGADTVGVVARQCTVRGSPAYGIVVAGGLHALLDCVVEDAGGIAFSEDAPSPLLANVVVGCRVQNFHSEFGLLLGPSVGQVTGCTVVQAHPSTHSRMTSLCTVRVAGLGVQFHDNKFLCRAVEDGGDATAWEPVPTHGVEINGPKWWSIQNNIILVDHAIGLCILNDTKSVVAHNTVVRCARRPWFAAQVPMLSVRVTQRGRATIPTVGGTLVLNNLVERVYVFNATVLASDNVELAQAQFRAVFEDHPRDLRPRARLPALEGCSFGDSLRSPDQAPVTCNDATAALRPTEASDFRPCVGALEPPHSITHGVDGERV